MLIIITIINIIIQHSSREIYFLANQSVLSILPAVNLTKDGIYIIFTISHVISREIFSSSLRFLHTATTGVVSIAWMFYTYIGAVCVGVNCNIYKAARSVNSCTPAPVNVRSAPHLPRCHHYMVLTYTFGTYLALYYVTYLIVFHKVFYA